MCPQIVLSLSGDVCLNDFLNTKFGEVASTDEVVRSDLSPDYIVALCPQSCKALSCISQASEFFSFQSSHFLLARPSLVKKVGYWFSHMDDSSDGNVISCLNNHIVNSVHPFAAIIEAERKLIEAKGNIDKLSDLCVGTKHSLPYLSISFKKATGIALKKFQAKILTCHIFHSIVFTEKPVKEVSYEYGIHPNDLRTRFLKQFSMTPKVVRQTRNRVLLHNSHKSHNIYEKE